MTYRRRTALALIPELTNGTSCGGEYSFTREIKQREPRGCGRVLQQTLVLWLARCYKPIAFRHIFKIPGLKPAFVSCDDADAAAGASADPPSPSRISRQLEFPALAAPPQHRRRLFLPVNIDLQRFEMPELCWCSCPCSLFFIQHQHRAPRAPRLGIACSHT